MLSYLSTTRGMSIVQVSSLTRESTFNLAVNSEPALINVPGDVIVTSIFTLSSFINVPVEPALEPLNGPISSKPKFQPAGDTRETS